MVVAMNAAASRQDPTAVIPGGINGQVMVGIVLLQSKVGHGGRWLLPWLFPYCARSKQSKGSGFIH